MIGPQGGICYFEIPAHFCPYPAGVEVKPRQGCSNEKDSQHIIEYSTAQEILPVMENEKKCKQCANQVVGIGWPQ